MSTETTPRPSTAAVLTRQDLMVVTATEAAARLGGYDSPVQVAVESGLSPAQVNVPVVDLGAHAGELLTGDGMLELDGFTVVSRGQR